MYNRRYDKAFIMLRQEMNGYSQGHRQPWGSGILEIKNGKGRLTITVQGLRPLDWSRSYSLYAMGQDGRGIFCTNISVDEHGKGQGRFAFDPDDLGDGQCIEDLSTLLVLVEGRSPGGLIAPLVGFFGEAVPWKTRFQFPKPKSAMATKAHTIETPLQQETHQATQTETLEQEKDGFRGEKKKLYPWQETVSAPTSSEPVIQFEAKKQSKVKEMPQYAEDILEACEALPQMPEFSSIQRPQREPRKETTTDKNSNSNNNYNSFQDNFRDMLLRFRQELEDLEDAGVLDEKDVDRIMQGSNTKGYHNVVREVALRQEQEGQRQGQAWDIMANPEVPQTSTEPAQAVVAPQKIDNRTVLEIELENIFIHNPVMKPFGQDNQVDWRLIYIEEMAVLPGTYYKKNNNPFFFGAYRKYRHFILGRDKEGTLCLGVPDTFYLDKQPEAMTLGFVDFMPCTGETMAEGAYGYWITQVQ